MSYDPNAAFLQVGPTYSATRQRLLDSAAAEKADAEAGKPIATVEENVLIPDETTRYTGYIPTGTRTTLIVADGTLAPGEITVTNDLTTNEKVALVKARLLAAAAARRDRMIEAGAPTEWGLARAGKDVRDLVTGAIALAKAAQDRGETYATRFQLVDGTLTPVFSGVEQIENYGIAIGQFVDQHYTPYNRLAAETTEATSLAKVIQIAKREALL